MRWYFWRWITMPWGAQNWFWNFDSSNGQVAPLLPMQPVAEPVHRLRGQKWGNLTVPAIKIPKPVLCSLYTPSAKVDLKTKKLPMGRPWPLENFGIFLWTMWFWKHFGEPNWFFDFLKILSENDTEYVYRGLSIVRWRFLTLHKLTISEYSFSIANCLQFNTLMKE